MEQNERRHFVRWKLNWQSKVKLEDEPDCLECRLRDISYKGAQMSLEKKLPRDIFITLTIVLSGEFAFTLEAWVAWHKVAHGVDTYGLYFTRVCDSDKEKIYQFLRRYFPQEINRHWWHGLEGEKGGENMIRTENEDRRIFARFPMELPLRFLDPDMNKEGYGQTQDISAKGISMVTHDELSPSSSVELWLNIPDRGEPLYTRGEVVWSQRSEPNKYRCGINLDKADLMGMSRALRVA
ncbi:MAG: PilZ domain-containing protein [Candidatus Omnitrophota bacterium]|jgi:hypothetical protein|nr:MAG: PilZ domain-containing protein [Candidatus Omnitrophota bacterium]